MVVVGRGGMFKFSFWSNSLSSLLVLLLKSFSLRPLTLSLTSGLTLPLNCLFDNLNELLNYFASSKTSALFSEVAISLSSFNFSYPNERMFFKSGSKMLSSSNE